MVAVSLAFMCSGLYSLKISQNSLHALRKKSLFSPPPQYMLQAASVTGVTYSITDTQSSQKCPCKPLPQRSTQRKHFTIYASFSAVNISVVARNAAGPSPAAVVSLASLGPMSKADVESEYTLEIGGVPFCRIRIFLQLLLLFSFSPECDRTLLGEKVRKRICLELYEFQDGAWRPAAVSNSTKRKYNNESKFFRRFNPFISTFGRRNKWVFCSFCCSDEGLHSLLLLWT